jgi:RND family efflux transporter MFP subunit
MAENELASILSRIRRMSAEVGGASDAQLLGRFVSNRDEAAFELLVWRHARLVFGVCRRELHDVHDAEDAFQATFVALARHAGRIARREAVAGWLYKVAYRVALTARRQRAGRRTRESVAAAERLSAPPDLDQSPENRELRQVLDQEIGRLPERFRAPVVLCYLEGKSVDEAAVQLGCPRGTVASRLVRARQRLQVRLTGRGLAPATGLAILSEPETSPRPLSLIPSLTAAALRYSAGEAAANCGLSRFVTTLTEEVVRAMFLHKLKTGIVALAALAGILLVGGGVVLGLRANAGPEDDPPDKGKVAEAPAPDRQQQAGDKPAARRSVTVTHPVRREAAPHHEYVGHLAPLRSVEVRPAVSGFVQAVLFKAGADVKKGDLLFELDPRASQLALQKARGDFAQAEAKKKQSDADLEQARRHYEAKHISTQELVNSTAQAEAAAAALNAAKLELARAELDFESTKITAPMSGQVGRPLVEPGTLVFRGQDRATLLTTVTSVDPIGLTFDILEGSFLNYQRFLREKKVEGAGSRLRLAVVEQEGFPIEGTLESFEDHADPQSGTVRVHGSVPNPDRLLLPGMFARVQMTVGPPRAVLEVPRGAIQFDQNNGLSRYVLVVNDCKVVERREVGLAPEEYGTRLIEKGLRPEDWVVVAGLEDVNPGDRVAPRKKAKSDH